MATVSSWAARGWCFDVGEGTTGASMNQSQTSPIVNGSSWALIATKGRELGRGYPIPAGETILGSAPPRESGLDLAGQEQSGTRSLAARHAAIEAQGGMLRLRDLESPGGTFVNRQRLLSGQVKLLQNGDVIQLGGIALRVAEHASAVPGPVAPVVSKAAPASPFLTARGARCASWDDFLVLAARDWRDLRDELATGRISAYLQRIGRLDLVPVMGADRTLDERLDLWLGRLPATLSAAPELDVHPSTVKVSATGIGGMVARTLKVTNVGYRMLRSTARIEPTSCGWLRIKGDRAFTTVDHSELELELEIPDDLGSPLEAAIVIESNGGTRRIVARLERGQVAAEPELAGREGSPGWVEGLVPRLAALSNRRRVILGAGLAVALRIMLLLIAWSPLGGLSPQGSGLASVATALAGLGILVGAGLGRARGTNQDTLAMGFTGGAAGLIIAAPLVALVQTLDPPSGLVLGRDAPAILAVPVWGVLGAFMGLLSGLITSARPPENEVFP